MIWKHIVETFFSKSTIYTIIITNDINDENIEKETAVNASFDIFFFVESIEFNDDVSKDITPNKSVNNIEKTVNKAFETSIEK